MEQWVLTVIQALSMGIEHWKNTAQVLDARVTELTEQNKKLDQEAKVAVKDLADVEERLLLEVGAVSNKLQEVSNECDELKIRFGLVNGHVSNCGCPECAEAEDVYGDDKVEDSAAEAAGEADEELPSVTPGPARNVATEA